MKILALDASTEACSAALSLDGEIHFRYEVAPRQHTRLILPMVDALLHEADLGLAALDLLAFDRGPGSFTGIRVTMSVVQGLALASDLPVLPVSSLAALAQACYRVHDAESVLSVIDARMGELYWGYYHLQQERMVLAGEEQVSTLEDLQPAPVEHCHVIGSGVSVYAEQLQQRGFDRLVDDEALRYPHARYLAELAAASPEQACAVELAEPVYLRNKVTG
jgi:tRNA threonylcarbamoyladenosine biosynthesis protein TsaB